MHSVVIAPNGVSTGGPDDAGIHVYGNVGCASIDFTGNGSGTIEGVTEIEGPEGSGNIYMGSTTIDGGLVVDGPTLLNDDLNMANGACINTTCLNDTSDRNLKENFAPISARDVLERVAGLPISSWNFKTDAKTRHVGPMAQDFYAAFKVGLDNRHIATVDESGVALAAIQGLNQKVEEKEIKIQKQDAEIQVLEARLEKLEQFLNAKNKSGQ